MNFNFFRLRDLWDQWRRSGQVNQQLDALILSSPDPTDSLRARMNWLEELLRWLIHRPLFVSVGPQDQVDTRQLRYLLMVLQRNQDLKRRCSRVLQSIFHDTSSVALLSGAGISTGATFFAEARERLMRRAVLEAPVDQDLFQLFRKVFATDLEIRWLASIDSILFAQILEILRFEVAEDRYLQEKWKAELRLALRVLSAEAASAGLGLSAERSHFVGGPIARSPFLKLGSAVERFLGVSEPQPGDVDQFFSDLRPCEEMVESISQELYRSGVSVNLVHELQTLTHIFDRIRRMTALMSDRTLSSLEILDFVLILAIESHSAQSLRQHVSQTIQLLARKISETNADVGDHYIARSPEEKKDLFRRSLGGGLITAFTAIIKAKMGALSNTGFVGGFLSSFNYAGSFLVIHFLDFTLGTKQPAMTAAALSQKLRESEQYNDLTQLRKEVWSILGSQGISILGNILAVLPAVYVIGLGLQHIGSGEYGLGISQAKAHSILSSVHIVGPSILFAAFTGVVLWMSSLAAGWANNWFLLRRQEEAIANHRRIRVFLGPERATRFAAACARHISGVVGNTSLGFLLGMLPPLLNFFSIPLDVRHVTLASGQVALAVSALGMDVLKKPEFWWAVAGLLIIGALNVLVSFGLALVTAIRAQPGTASQRRTVYRQLFRIITWTSSSKPRPPSPRAM